eukprot:TRINITY_DN283_c0_g1_i1.p1 TRINITY_DN283_c0_g1~~TRINITY_DN283_c0_g1_i1.p1  ORF type:complete len:312 (+),score=104.12 TRINITY_DN283_c0_g1_i1:73-1008(+)
MGYFFFCWCGVFGCLFVFFFFFSSRRRHTRCREVSWARRCVQETGINAEYMGKQKMQATGYANKKTAERKGVSGVRAMHGEDLYAGDRKLMQSIQMKDWLTQQMEEKEFKKKMEAEEARAYADQTLAITSLRKQAEEDHKERLRKMAEAMREQNLQLAQEKKDREAREKESRMQADSHEIAFTVTSDFMTENPDTCVSAMTANRVKKDHWKGMNEAQRSAILNTMAEQVSDAKKKKELEKEAERLWAEQEEAKRQLIIKQTIAKQKKERDMMNALKETHKIQKAEKDAKWPNYYGEKLSMDKPIEQRLDNS